MSRTSAGAQNALFASLASQLYQVARPYSTAYGKLLGITALLTAGESPDLRLIGASLVLAFCFPLSMLVLHDSLHRAADARAGRGRNYDHRFLIGLGVASCAVTLLVAAAAGWATLAWIVVSIGAGLAYGLLKSVPVVANIARGGTSAGLILTIGSMTKITTTTLIIAGAALLLDAAGNVWGDVRDQGVDRRAGVRTIAVLSPRLSVYTALLLHIAAVGVLAFLSPAWSLALPLGFIPCMLPPFWGHAAYLMVKYGVVGLVALNLAHAAAAGVAGFIVLCLMISAIPSLHVYRQLHQPKLQEIFS